MRRSARRVPGRARRQGLSPPPTLPPARCGRMVLVFQRASQGITGFRRDGAAAACWPCWPWRRPGRVVAHWPLRWTVTQTDTGRSGRRALAETCQRPPADCLRGFSGRTDGTQAALVRRQAVLARAGRGNRPERAGVSRSFGSVSIHVARLSSCCPAHSSAADFPRLPECLDTAGMILILQYTRLRPTEYDPPPDRRSR